MDGKQKDGMSQPLQLTDVAVHWEIEEELVNGVISAAVWMEGRRPGVWQGMIHALNHGADKTKEGTVNAFLFRAMVDRLLEEFRALNSQ